MSMPMNFHNFSTFCPRPLAQLVMHKIRFIYVLFYEKCPINFDMERDLQLSTCRYLVARYIYIVNVKDNLEKKFI